MNRYVMIRRLRGPAFLLLVGVNALLAQQGILGWSQSWPFYLILAGLLMLAERAALAWDGYPPVPGAPWSGAGPGINPGASSNAPAAGTGQGTNASVPPASAGQASGQVSGQAAEEGPAYRSPEISGAIVPPQWQEFNDEKKGGQS